MNHRLTQMNTDRHSVFISVKIRAHLWLNNVFRFPWEREKVVTTFVED